MLERFDAQTMRHASHEACELKSLQMRQTLSATCHASHEACELKSFPFPDIDGDGSHASHEACELKF